MEFRKGDLVECVLPDDQGRAVRRARFVEICDPNETVLFDGRPGDAAWVQWLDGDDEGAVGRVPRRPLTPVRSGNYQAGVTSWLRDGDDPDAFWANLSAHPPDRDIRLHLRDGTTDQGPFVGTNEASGEAYAPEPDGLAAIATDDGEDTRTHLRADIIGFTPLD